MRVSASNVFTTISFTSAVVFTSILVLIKADEEWHQDLSSDMKIGLADGGYEKVKLRCSADFMHVDLVTDQDFSGVIYTRGSFHKKKPPCFLNPQRAGREFTLKIPLNKCQTLQDGDIYSNVVVVQYDKDLIMPGDAAFTLECDFSRPRDITVSANLNAEKKVAASRISLIDADPAAESLPRHKRSFVERNGEEVEFTPADVVKDSAPSSSRKVDDEL